MDRSSWENVKGWVSSEWHIIGLVLLLAFTAAFAELRLQSAYEVAARYKVEVERVQDLYQHELMLRRAENDQAHELLEDSYRERLALYKLMHVTGISVGKTTFSAPPKEAMSLSEKGK